METDFDRHSQDLGMSDRRRGGTKAKSTAARIAGVSAVALGLALASGGIAGAATTKGAESTPGGLTPRHAPPFGGTTPAAVGTVKSVGAATFTITTRHGTVVTVDVTGTTTYRDRGVTAPTFADVTVGSHVAVVGTDTSNTVAATNVVIGGFGGHRFGNGVSSTA